MAKIGVLLINLGTPDDCDPTSVYRYLKEFLNDPRVIDLPNFLRKPLVNLLIVPWRHKKSAAAYQKIWQTCSPLLTNSQQLTYALADQLGTPYKVELAMRYGKPSVESALASLKDCSQIIAIPLYPQYASAATGSVIEKLLSQLAIRWNIPGLIIKRDFYEHPGFIKAYVEVIRASIHNKPIDMLLFSYHGLPLRHLKKSECQGPCDQVAACPAINRSNHFCYRAQCFATSHLLASALNLAPHQYQIAFQSRLGRTPWIKPYTDKLLPALIKKGIRNIAIVCPSFVADCLETLEEINIRAREQWQALGGESFTFIPCLNAHPTWVSALSDMVKEYSFTPTAR